MNIKKSGILKELTCLQCNSVLEVGPEDIETSDIGHPHGAWFVCPVCGKHNSMDGKIPRDWNHIVYKDEPV